MRGRLKGLAFISSHLHFPAWTPTAGRNLISTSSSATAQVADLAPEAPDSRALPPVGRPRYAIPYFMGPHLDTAIACLPTCQGPGNPPRYPPITYAAYLDWWYDANYNAARQRDVA